MGDRRNEAAHTMSSKCSSVLILKIFVKCSSTLVGHLPALPAAHQLGRAVHGNGDRGSRSVSRSRGHIRVSLFTFLPCERRLTAVLAFTSPCVSFVYLQKWQVGGRRYLTGPAGGNRGGSPVRVSVSMPWHRTRAREESDERRCTPPTAICFRRNRRSEPRAGSKVPIA